MSVTVQAAWGKTSFHSANFLVGGEDDGAVVVVSTGDDLEEEVGVAIGIGEVSDLVDAEETWLCIAT